MSNFDILSKADRALRPVLKALRRFSWMQIEGCCAGHKQEDSLYIELNILGIMGLEKLRELLTILNTKLSDTEIRADCLLSCAADAEEIPVPFGWTPMSIEVYWPPKPEWRRSQTMVIEAMLSSIEEFGSKIEDPSRSDGAINFCPFCSSAFVRLEAIGAADHKYRCGDCGMGWTISGPVA